MRSLVTPDVDRVVMRCLERQQDDRFQTAIDLATALDEILPGVDEVVTRMAAGVPSTLPGVPHGMSGFASTLPGVAGAVPGISATPTGSPRLLSMAAKAEWPGSKAAPPAGPSMKQADSKTDPAAGKLDAATSKTEPAAGKLEPTEEAEESDSQADPVTVKRLPVSKAAVIARREEIAKREEVARREAARNLTPVPKPAPADFDSTLIGHALAERRATIASARHPVTPGGGTPLIPAKNLREVYPAISRPPPSPMRPPMSPFDDRPASSVGGIAPFDMARRVRRDAVFRRLALVIGLVIVAIVAILVASRL
jgi:hypothetical protein